MTTDPLDRYVRLLAHPNRRRCLEQLWTESNGTTSVADLAEAMLRAEADASATDGEAGRRLAIRLHHVDLPKLAAHGIVEYDPSSGLVSYRRDAVAETAMEAILETTVAP
jgi:hypothetical protein